MAKVRVRKNRTKQYLATANTAMEGAIADAAIIIQRQARMLLNKGKSPPPSKPGTPPHNLTGQLNESIEEETLRIPKGNGAYVFVGRVGSNLEYARIHELGGVIKHPGGTPYFIKDGELVFVRKGTSNTLPVTKPHDIPMPARPYLRPALRMSQKAIKKRIRAASADGIRGGKRRGR